MSTRIAGLVTIVLLVQGAASAGAQPTISRESWIDNGRRVAVEVEGEVEYTDDSRAVESMEPGSRLALLEERPGMPARRVELRGGANGSIERRYWEDGTPHAYDATAESWFRDLLNEVIRRRSSSSSSRSSSATSSETIEPPARPRGQAPEPPAGPLR